jgi:hypothetical protein
MPSKTATWPGKLKKGGHEAAAAAATAAGEKFNPARGNIFFAWVPFYIEGLLLGNSDVYFGHIKLPQAVQRGAQQFP